MPTDVEMGWSLIQCSAQSNKDSGWLAQWHCFRYGHGVKKNLAVAIDRCKRALDTSDFTQQDQDYMKAFENYDHCAFQINSGAQWKVALWCESGIGVEQNVHRAVHYFRMAANSGHKDAQIKSLK